MIVRFQESVANSILSSALQAYPKESILLLRGKVSGDEMVIHDVVIPPLATHGRGFSNFPGFMLPFDLSIMGIAHSHPSGALRPSTHDLNHFYGRVMVITAYPYASYHDIGAFNSHGDRIMHEVIPDEPNRIED